MDNKNRSTEVGEKLLELLALTACSVTIEINRHRVYYESADKALADLEACHPLEIEPEVRAEMIATNTVVNVSVYPRTRVGFYDIYHYRLDDALDEALACVKGEQG